MIVIGCCDFRFLRTPCPIVTQLVYPSVQRPWSTSSSSSCTPATSSSTASTPQSSRTLSRLDKPYWYLQILFDPNHWSSVFRIPMRIQGSVPWYVKKKDLKGHFIYILEILQALLFLFHTFGLWCPFDTRSLDPARIAKIWDPGIFGHQENV